LPFPVSNSTPTSVVKYSVFLLCKGVPEIITNIKICKTSQTLQLTMYRSFIYSVQLFYTSAYFMNIFLILKLKPSKHT
jgi:hypothetical protein